MSRALQRPLVLLPQCVLHPAFQLSLPNFSVAAQVSEHRPLNCSSIKPNLNHPNVLGTDRHQTTECPWGSEWTGSNRKQGGKEEKEEEEKTSELDAMLFSSNRPTILCGANSMASVSAASASCGTLACSFLNISSGRPVLPIGQQRIDAFAVVVLDTGHFGFRDLRIRQPTGFKSCRWKTLKFTLLELGKV
ncbi:hypothetical protein LX36DRAFT_664328 [Colletotrichum falcatum]|nr:hypothetical protein LX36DRAFT_664328 [Colletotrichum falcatum]